MSEEKRPNRKRDISSMLEANEVRSVSVELSHLSIQQPPAKRHKKNNISKKTRKRKLSPITHTNSSLHSTQPRPAKKQKKNLLVFPCPHCHRTFDTEHVLAVHQSVHKTEPQAVATQTLPQNALNFPCSQCARTFDTKHGLSIHQNIHKKNKEPVETENCTQNLLDYSCGQCDRSFDNQRSLTKHENIHKKQKQRKNIREKSKKKQNYNPQQRQEKHQQNYINPVVPKLVV